MHLVRAVVDPEGARIAENTLDDTFAGDAAAAQNHFAVEDDGRSRPPLASITAPTPPATRRAPPRTAPRLGCSVFPIATVTRWPGWMP